MTPNQKAALRQALGTHSLGMVTKSMTPEELQELPEDYQVPTYTANASPLYDNQLFPKITSAEDLIDIGYATPDGRSTQSGQMAIALKKAGALNDDYTLNDTGKAMMANPADLLEEENLPLYLKAKELDLDGSGRELSWGETFGRFYKESKDSVKALYNIASGPAPTTKEEKAAFDLEVQAGLGGAVKSGAALAMGLSEIAGSGLIKALSDTEEEEDLALASLNQRFEKLDYEIKNAKAADVIDGLGEMVGAELGVGEAREQNIQTVGEERTKEIERRGESAGQFAAMFSPYGPAAMTGKVAFGVAGKGLGAAFKPISRSLLQADLKAAQVLDKTKQLAALQRQASGLQVATQAAEKKTVFAESMAQRLSQAGLVDRANNALRIANQFRTTGQEAATRLGGFTDEIATVSDDLAKATQGANVADKVLQVTQKARQIPYLPITALGKTLEATGRGMIGIDKGLSSLASKIGADKAYNAMNKITSLSGLGGAGAALGLGPAAFIPAAIRATWSTAPFIKATGEYISLVGKEATKARGQIGFWKRIYEMPNKGPAHRAVSGLMDTATMGGRIPGAVSNVAKGLVASYPVDLAYEWVSEGGDFNPNILKQAAVETLFFGGTGAALGGITMGGANRIKTLQNGDALNFYRSISDPSQRVMYNGMPSDMKRVIGTFSASNPGAKIQFVDQGAGAYDRNTKTVMVNPNAANPLKPLLTHEFMHHMLNNGIGDGVVAQLVGDGFQTGGLLRGRDGSYDPQYEAFKDEYVNRLRSQHERTVKMRDAIGDPMTKSEREFQTPDEKYLAEEYFIEVNVDDMLGMAESGKLGGIAGRMIINDKARALGDAILNKSAILRDLHFRIGGVMDNKGKMVTGNGFLSGKLYQSPEVRRMFQKMVNESVGRKGGIDAAKRKARNGIEIPVTGKNDPILGEVSSLWETDADGNPYLDASGEYIPLKKETDELRSQAGMLLVDDLKARQARGEVIPEGELSYNPDNNTWSGQYLNDRQIELLNLSGRFNSKQIKQLKLLNAAARDTSNTTANPAARGHRFSVIYQPALKKNRKGQWRYDQIKPQLRDVVPYGVEISKDGNILIRVMSTNQLFANASEKSANKRGRALYDGNMETILRDVNAVIDSHGKNQPTDAYFKDKYGGQWEQHKSFINSVFGNVGAGHKDINPLVASDRVDAVVKSYRLDRMNKATQLVGSTQLPYQNNLVKINYLPEGEPIMDADGEPKDLRYTPSYEAVSQVRMPEQARQMPESLDADYMKAVESGDVEAQQRMVDAAAKAAGFNVGPLYHGSENFKGTKLENPNKQFTANHSFWFTDDIELAEYYAGYPDEPRTLLSEDQDGPAILQFYIKDPDLELDRRNYEGEEFKEKSPVMDANLQLSLGRNQVVKITNIDDKIDSEVVGDSTVYGVRDADLARSADPILRDSSGNVIPLSQRFNEKSSDIRYMPEGEKVPVAEVMKELDSTNFIPTNLAAGILGSFPEYLLPVAEFIANQREKLVSGSLTSRDIWKAYAVTVASQGTGAVGVDTLKKKLANEGINFDPKPLFTDKGKAGQETIRPEEAAAYWLGTEAGKFALDNAEAGKTTAADWDELVRIRKAYGDDRFKTFNVFSEKNLSKIPVVVDKLNSSKGDSKQVLEAVQLLNGVSTGKKGFISHLLGLGDTPTIDAVEINFWLTGKGDVGTLKTKEADLARRVKNTFSDKRVREEMFRRVDESIQALQGSVEGGDKIPRDVWAHIVHHWLWDKAKGLETTHKGMYEAQKRYMPEPLPQNYKSSRDQTFLRASIGPDGIVNLSRPLKSTEALPPISTRHEYPEEDFKVSKFNKRAAIKYATNKKGEDITFKFDPKLMRRPAFGDFDQLYNGATVQLAMADRHGATDGDMGGHSFPDLKVNQENIVDDGNGNSYKLVWSNNAWGPVKNMSTKAQKYGATTLLTYNMDQHAHDSNTRTVRIFSNEIENSNLSTEDQSTLLIVMNVALKKAQASANKKVLRQLLKNQKDLLESLGKDDKAIAKAKGYAGKIPLSPEERLTLENDVESIKKEIEEENKFLKESLGAKSASDEEVEVDALFRNYQNKRRAYDKMPTSTSKQKSMMDAEKALKQYQKTKGFKVAEELLPSRELDKFSNTFKGRKSLILAVKNKEASVKWGEFDSQKISQAIGDQLTGDSLHVVSSVELSNDPEFKAVYLGDDPKEIARMSQAEQKAALKLKSKPNFVPHEAYLWSMLGPAESKHIFNTNQRSVLESFPDFVDEYSKLPVKAGKFTLNDPNSKASEFNIVNTIRDQSKIGIVFRAKKADDQGEPETKK